MLNSQIPDDVLYTREHHWIRVEDSVATIGLTDHAQNELGDVVFVDLPEPGTEYHAADEMGCIESVKTSTDLYAPVSGSILEANPLLEKSPDLINRDPYGDGWLVRMKLTDISETEDLLSAEDYGNLVEEGE